MLLFTLLVQLSFSLELCYSWFQKCLTKKLKQGPDLRYLRWPFGGGGYFGFSPFGFHLNLMRLRGMVKKDCCCWKIKTFNENNFFDISKTVVVVRLRPSMKITEVVVGRLRPSWEMGSKIATCRPAYRR